jgi:putative nucleotidyltransferase with HDIG domain
MNYVYFFIRKQHNTAYFYGKLLILFIILSLWLFNTKFLSGESNLYLSIALIVSLFSTLGFGIFFKSQPYNEFIIGLSILIDIVNNFILVFLSFTSYAIFVLITVLLLIQINFFLAKKMRQIYSAIYFISLLAIIIHFGLINHYDDVKIIVGLLFLISIFIYALLEIGLSAIDYFEKELLSISKEKKKLVNDHDKLSKEIRITNQQLDNVNRDLRKKSIEIQNILNLSGQFGENLNAAQIISTFLLTIIGQLGCSYALYFGCEETGFNYYSILDQKGINDKRINKLRIYNDSFIIQLCKATNEPFFIKNIPRQQLYRDEEELLSYFYNDVLCPIRISNKVIGMFIISNKISGAVFTKDDMNLITILSNQAAFILEQLNINNEIYDFYNKTVRVLIRSLEAKYSYAKGHALRTAQYVQVIGKRMNFSVEDLKILTNGTILHDVGKIAIKDEILNYDKIISAENEVIKRKILEHTVIGASILKSVGFDDKLVDLALHHHEWFNGKGYPNGLKGDNISLSSRILAVCNAFDAMISDNPYRKSHNEDWAKEQLIKCSGLQFDPDIVNIFLHEIENNQLLKNIH